MAKIVTSETEELREVYKLNPVTKFNAVEVELSGDKDALLEAIKRLKSSNKPMKAIFVPESSMEIARDLLRTHAASATLIDTSGKQRIFVSSASTTIKKKQTQIN